MSLTVGTTVPLYNSSAFILQLLESICQQSTKLDQVVLVDDASIDNTPNIVEDFISKNKSHCKDFHLIKLKSNSGPSFSANIGIHNLNTDIVLFSGHDDIWSFDRTEESMKLFENGFDFIFSQYETFGIKNETIYVHTNWADTALEMMGKNSIGAITVGVNASKIGKKNLFFNSRFDGAEDFDLWTDLILLGYQPYGIQKSLMKYRTSESQLSRNFDYKGSGIIKKIQLYNSS